MVEDKSEALGKCLRGRKFSVISRHSEIKIIIKIGGNGWVKLVERKFCAKMCGVMFFERMRE